MPDFILFKVIDSDTGSLVLADSKAVVTYDAEIAHYLNILMDPDGKTCATEDYEGVEWANVVERARKALSGHIQDRLAVIVAAEGFFCLRLQTSPPSRAEIERRHEVLNLRLSAPSGKITLGDGMYLFDIDGDSAYDLEDITVEPGTYDLIVHHLKPDLELVPVVGAFGEEDTPAVIIELRRSTAADSTDGQIDVRLDMSLWTRQPAAAALCMVAVTRIDAETAHGDIHLTNQTTSGSVRFPIPEAVTLTKGDDICVLLENNMGSYWTASLIQEG